MEVSRPEQSYDLVVIGGGMVGASFACALDKLISESSAEREFSILVVEAFSPSASVLEQPSFDARSTALSYGSSLILKRSGIWQGLEDHVTPITEIQVSDKDHFGVTDLKASDYDLAALGFVFENRDLGRVLNKKLKSSKRINFLSPASIESAKPTQEGMRLRLSSQSGSYQVDAGLVVLADGGKSPLCRQLGIGHDVDAYDQQALISNIAFENPHKNVAYERFTDTGPLAVLPLESIDSQNRASLVWTLTEQQRSEIMALDDKEILLALMRRFGNRLGKITKIGERVCYPLSLSVAKEQIRPGLVLLGNVAHTLHPVAGQGLNLALRDQQALLNTLLAALEEGRPIGDMSVLQSYLDAQVSDQNKTIALTDSLTRMFSSNSHARVWLRKFGLLSIDLLPPVKRELAKQAMGLAGA